MKSGELSALIQISVTDDTSSLSTLNAVKSTPLSVKSPERSNRSTSSSSLLFIDSRVGDYQSLIAGTQPGTEVYVLNSTDAIAQITQALTGRSNISSLHILSHGAAGSLELGNDRVDLGDLNRHADQLQSWASALTDDADILLYGCDVAGGEVGQIFVQQLAKLTGADIAASDDLTGNSTLGGNWNLEATTGRIETPLAFGQSTLSQYTQTLNIIINEFQRATGTGTHSFSNAEYVEFLLTADYNATELQNLFFGDSNGTTTQKSGIYRFNNLSSIASTFKAGTIIAVGGSTPVSTEDITYNPITGGTDDEWNLRLKFGGSYITGSGGDFSGSQDAAWVDNSGAGTLTSIHSIAYLTTGLYGAFGNAAVIKLNGATTNNVVLFSGNGSQSTDSSKFSFAASGSLGLANGGDNTTYINSLRNPSAPPTAQPSNVAFSEDTTYSFQASDFSYSAPNGTTLQAVQINQLPTVGQFFLDANGDNTQDTGEAVTVSQTIALADISKLKFKPVANANGNSYADFKFKISNGQAFSASDATMTLNVNSVNDAPLLDISGSPALPSISQGVVNPAGMRVTDLIASLGGTGITDIDGAIKGIAITGADDTNGTWQFSTNGGTSWTNLGTVSDTTATLLGATPLYTPDLGNTADAQSWLSYNNLRSTSGIVSPGNSTQSVSTNGTLLNTTGDIRNYAGYTNYQTNPDLSQSLKNPAFPSLDRTSGYSLSFNLQVLQESHTNNDRGFTVTLLDKDSLGIELCLQFDGTNGRIFAQSLNAQNQFVGAESISFNTNSLTSYTVAIQGNTYQLLANGTQILTGTLRDYRNWTSPDGFPSPYALPNFVFLGDSTTSAQGIFNVGQIALQTDTRVRFVPNSSYAGNSQISFRAWDTTNGGSNGQANVNATNNGGATAFSTAVETATIAIKPLPTLSINNVSQVEGNSGPKTYTFTVTLSQASTETVTVNYGTIDGSATIANNDYLAKSSTLTFAVGETSKTIEIQVNGDNNFELDETFRVKLSNASNAKIVSGADIGVGTILDDDRAQWSIVKTADFDKDGSQDVLWRNVSTGGTAIWKMNGTTFVTSTPLPVADLTWNIEGVADFDKNGFVDILWRNTSTGANAIWKMNGFTVTSSVALSAAPREWSITSLADFDKDGFVDILWRNETTGGNAIWKMNSTSVGTSIALSAASKDWRIAGLADFDKDGFVDILWHNEATGGNAFWKMNGTSVATSIALSATDSTWQIAGVADFDNDGFADILWRNTTTGSTAIWKMNGTSNVSSTSLSFADLSSQIEDITDLDGDGFVDILWRNDSTGNNALWKMNGTSVVSSIVLRPA